MSFESFTEKFNLKAAFSSDAVKKRLVSYPLITAITFSMVTAAQFLAKYDLDHFEYDAEAYQALNHVAAETKQSLSYRAKDFNKNRYSFHGVKGLTQNELESLVDEHADTLQYSARLASSTHYSNPEYTDLLQGRDVVDFVAKMHPEKDYSREELKVAIEQETRKMLQGLDLRSTYLNVKQARKHYDRIVNNRMVTLGIRLEQIEQGLRIAEVDSRSESSLIPGDIITHINGQNIVEQNVQFIEGLLPTKADQKVDLTVISAQNGQTIERSVTSRYVDLNPVKSSVIDDRALLIEISHFSKHTADRVRQFILDTQNEYGDKLHGIIFDLRNNGGGMAYEAHVMLDDLTDETVLLNYETRKTYLSDLNRLFFQATGDEVHENDIVTGQVGKITDLPIKVLTNNGSASASEILAGTLKGLGRAEIIGKTPTYGKATAQTVIRFEGEEETTQINLTNAVIELPKIGVYQNIGILPNIQVMPDYEGQLDNLGYERLNKNALPNPRKSVQVELPQLQCKVVQNQGSGLSEAWVQSIDTTSKETIEFNIKQDSDLACALDRLSGENQYTISRLHPSIPQS